MILVRLTWFLALWSLSLCVAQLAVCHSKLVNRALPASKLRARFWLTINRPGN